MKLSVSKARCIKSFKNWESIQFGASLPFSRYCLFSFMESSAGLSRVIKREYLILPSHPFLWVSGRISIDFPLTQSPSFTSTRNFLIVAKKDFLVATLQSSSFHWSFFAHIFQLMENFPMVESILNLLGSLSRFLSVHISLFVAKVDGKWTEQLV